MLVENGRCDLHALVGVARHEVGARDIHLHVLALAEAVDAGVLQEAPHDGDDGDVVRLALDACDEAADAAHDEPHLDARLARLDEL